MSFCSLTKGITPKICRLCVCVIINKRSFEPFMCLIMFLVDRKIENDAKFASFEIRMSWLWQQCLYGELLQILWVCAQKIKPRPPEMALLRIFILLIFSKYQVCLRSLFFIIHMFLVFSLYICSRSFHYTYVLVFSSVVPMFWHQHKMMDSGSAEWVSVLLCEDEPEKAFCLPAAPHTAALCY